MYVTISVGNTDNKLTQLEWASFVDEMNTVIENAGKLHFFGGPSNYVLWQNVAWLVELPGNFEVAALSFRVREIRERYKQDSAFFMVGKGVFI